MNGEFSSGAHGEASGLIVTIVDHPKGFLMRLEHDGASMTLDREEVLVLHEKLSAKLGDETKLCDPCRRRTWSGKESVNNRTCPKCKQAHVIPDGYCGVCRECTLQPLSVERGTDSQQRVVTPRHTDWNTSEPPKDGTTIVAVGRVIWRDEYSTSVDSFVAAIRWIKDQSEYEGWHFDRDGMTIARTLDDEVKVDWWMPMPKE